MATHVQRSRIPIARDEAYIANLTPSLALSVMALGRRSCRSTTDAFRGWGGRTGSSAWWPRSASRPRRWPRARFPSLTGGFGWIFCAFGGTGSAQKLWRVGFAPAAISSSSTCDRRGRSPLDAHERVENGRSPFLNAQLCASRRVGGRRHFCARDDAPPAILLIRPGEGSGREKQGWCQPRTSRNGAQ